MRKLFTKLYLLLICAILGFGWALDQLWFSTTERYADKNSISIIKLITERLSETDSLVWNDLLERYRSADYGQLTVMQTSELHAKQDIIQRMNQGEVVYLGSDGMVQSYIASIPNTKSYILFKTKDQEYNGIIQLVLLILFYLGIAIIIVIWLWPVHQAIKAIELGANQYALGDWSHRINIPESSPLLHLSQTLNQMAGKIESLLLSHKELTNAISHEFRTPLARMKFSLEIASHKQNPELLQEQLVKIKGDVAELDQLVSELLTLAKLEREIPSLNKEHGYIEEMIGGQLNKLKETNPKLQLVLETDNAGNKSVCDFHLMERAIQNLLINAARYAKQKIYINFSSMDGFNRVSVSDDGSGIEEEDIASVFMPFMRSEKSVNSGFGLGLSIVKRIMEWHDGTVEYQQSALGGACFILQWPNK